MAFITESPKLKFENPYANPYIDAIPRVSDKLERHQSGSSTQHSQCTEKEERDVEDVEDVNAAKEEAEDDYGAKHEHTLAEPALPFQNITAPDAIRRLSFRHPDFYRKDLIIQDEGGKAIYYADVARWTNKPDIVLHTGESAHHPIAAVARFRYSRHLRLGLGDSANQQALDWREMRNTKKLGHSRYRLEVPEPEPVASRERRAIVFQRTHSKEDGVTNRLNCMNYKIVDEETGELLAMYLATGWKDWKKRATLHIKSRFLAGDAEVLVVLGMCGLVEMSDC